MWQAYATEHGLEVAVSDEAAFKRRFYAERAKARAEGCFDLDVLKLITPPPDVTGKLWIVKDGQVQRTEEGESSQEDD